MNQDTIYVASEWYNSEVGTGLGIMLGMIGIGVLIYLFLKGLSD